MFEDVTDFICFIQSYQCLLLTIALNVNEISLFTILQKILLLTITYNFQLLYKVLICDVETLYIILRRGYKLLSWLMWKQKLNE